ncbi:MAG: prolyl oligopeptidase family serine peptidase [Gammaproteobacteria bacterium]|nr:prolyl oligopeptidase family serine peptidase [Gammaproteobacteria bacterium]
MIYSESYQDADAIYSMSLSDGSITGPMFEEEKTDIQSILTTSLNRKFDGILYSGLLPSYQFLDENHQANMAAIQDLYPGSEIHPISNTADKSRSVILVSGNEGADNYLIFDSIERRVSLLGTGYPEVSKDKIAPVKAIRYKARDGLSISAIITKPLNSENAKKLPMIVMPHGGPESYDSIRFDWWAQFLARKGYLVLQPNFRGSSGFGNDFRIAGRGKWGKEMQDDVSDGVLAMIKTGAADPDRVCIVGASYGGYAAMAGGAFSPDLYRCVVAVAGVSDIPKMLRDQAYTSGKRHWVVSYWNSVIGNSKSEKEKLNKISPVNAAANFKAPLLMLHGKDDTVVPIVQSKRMLKAMRKAGKQAELITLKGEDHWLSSSETRLELLKSVSDFLDQYNPTDNLIPMESLNHSSAVQ